MSGKKILLKFGSGILTRTDRAETDEEQICKLVQAIAELKRNGHQVVVVSSGAVAAGLKAMNFKERPTDIVTLQACAAVGQSYLMHTYQSYLRGHGLHVGQLLLTHADLENKERAERTQSTLLRLLQSPNIIPIINENDSVAVEELKFGDNDKLSSRVAVLWKADLLILLTSVPGLMDIRDDGSVNIVAEVNNVEEVLHLAQEAKGTYSVGGMGSKLRAVQDAIKGGVSCIIASGRHPEQISTLVNGGGTCTRFPVPSVSV